MEFGVYMKRIKFPKKKSSKNIFLLSFLFFSMIFSDGYSIVVAQTQNETEKRAEQNRQMDERELYAKSAVLMDGKSRRVLFHKNGNQALPMASTTKIMTCIVALENGRENEEATVSAYAASQPQVRLGLRCGEKVKIKDLLYSMMLESHNDSAVVIAEHIGGSVEAFAKLMNEKADEIGCKDTYFITPNGLDARKDGKMHHTTAEDLAKILSYCLNGSEKSKRFREITTTKSYQVKGRTCFNHNRLLEMTEGASGGKTGFTCEAGYCYTGSVEREGKSLVVALLACGWPNNKGYKWSDCKKLFQYGFEQYKNVSLEKILKEKKNQKYYFEVENGENILNKKRKVMGAGRVENIHGKKEILLREGENVIVKEQIDQKLQAPVSTQTQIGTISAYVAGECYASMPVYSKEEIREKTYSFVCYKIIEKLLTFEILA